MIAGNLIGITILLMIPLPHSGKMPIQLLIKILPASLPQSHSNAKTNDPVNLCTCTVIQNPPQVFLRVIDKRKQGREPHHRGNPVVPENLKGLKALLCSADPGLQNPAQFLVISRQRHLHHALCLLMNPFKQLQIPQNPAGFRLYCKAEAIPVNDFQTLPGKPQLLLAVHIRIAHGAGSDHAFFSLGAQSPLQKLRGIFLHLNILKGVIHLIAFAAAVTVDAAMSTAPIQIHPVFCR